MHIAKFVKVAFRTQKAIFFDINEKNVYFYIKEASLNFVKFLVV